MGQDFSKTSKHVTYLYSGDAKTASAVLLRDKKSFSLLQQVQLFFSKRNALSDRQQVLVKKIAGLLANDVTGIALMSTDEKHLRWSGLASTRNGFYSVKAFPDHDEAAHEQLQTQIVEAHFSGPFVVPHIVSCQHGVIMADYIPHYRRVTTEDGLVDRLLHYTEQAVVQTKSYKRPEDFMPVNFPGLFAKLENTHLTLTVKDYLEAVDHAVPIIPVHGDMAPWNIYVDQQERLILNSFERAGWHVPFYDVFHFHLQPEALMAAKVRPLQNLLAHLPWEETPWLKTALILYLVDQLCNDLTDLYDRNYLQDWLPRMIKVKSNWLLELFD